jgi:SLOG in TRPM, prokaryote
MTPLDGAMPHYMPFTIQFPSGNEALAVRAPELGDPESIRGALKLDYSPLLFIIGGAGLMEDTEMSATRAAIENALARVAQEQSLTVIDGGTAAGVMELMGAARKKDNYTFPLIGIAPNACVGYPGHEIESETHLDSGHSHFVLTDGDEFGDESDMIAMLATLLSRDQRLRALGLVINGGNISLHEVYARTSGSTMRFPLLVLEGSGRLADDLANAKRGESIKEEDREQFQEILRGNIDFLSIKQGPETLYQWLTHYFSAQR